MAHAILRLPQVKAVTGLSRSSIYNYIANGSFPRQVRLGPRCVGWIEQEVDAWVAGLIASREGEQREVPQRSTAAPWGGS